MKGPYYLLRYVRGRDVELVAIVHDTEMMLAWVGRRPRGEIRRAVRDTYGVFTCTR